MAAALLDDFEGQADDLGAGAHDPAASSGRRR